MRVAVRIVLPLALAVLAVPAAAQRRPGAQPTNWSAVQRQYNAAVLRDHNQLVEGWVQAWVKADAREIGRNYAEDAVIVFPDDVGFGEKVSSRPAIERWLEERVKKFSEVRVALSDFHASGGMAFATGTYYLQKRPAVGATASEGDVLTGNYIAVIIEDKGRWKFQSQVFVPEAPSSAAGRSAASNADSTGSSTGSNGTP